MTGLFINFEGIDGSGKSTQVSMLAEGLEDLGRRVKSVRFPDRDENGPQIATKLYGDRKFNPKVWALLHAADRAYHAEETIYSSLQSGFDVVCDRYDLSSIAYQAGGQGIDEEFIERITSFSAGRAIPDVTFLIDVPLAVAEGRVKSRCTDTWFDWEFLDRVRSKYLERAERNPDIVVINGVGNPYDISQEIFHYVRGMILCH